MRLWWHRWMVGAGSGCCLAAWLAERAELLHITCARHTHTVHTVTIMHQRFNNCFCNHIIANFPPAPCLNHRSWINMVREESCVHRESQILQNFRCLRSIQHSQGQHSLRHFCLLQISYEKRNFLALEYSHWGSKLSALIFRAHCAGSHVLHKVQWLWWVMHDGFVCTFGGMIFEIWSDLSVLNMFSCWFVFQHLIYKYCCEFATSNLQLIVV